MAIVEISITATDIKRAGFQNHTCPVARAIRRSLRLPLASVGVGYDFIRIDASYIKTPADVRKFIRLFDARTPVEPLAFKLNVLRTK